MAKNKLTPQQDIITRQFFQLVTQRAEHDPDELRTAQTICMNLLNYECTPDGRFVERDSRDFYPFGDKPVNDGPCEWLDDYKVALKQGGKDARLNTRDSFAPNSGEQSKDTEIREAVLREDV